MIFERKLSDIICDNFAIDGLQKLVFRVPGELNPATKRNAVFRAKLDFDAIAQMVDV